MNKEAGVFVTFDGLDATGKSKIIETLAHEYHGFTLVSPPVWMRRYRDMINKYPVGLRLLFYAFGNTYNDHVMIQPLREQGETIFLDRSWISTLASHDLRGANPSVLSCSVKIASLGEKPDTSIIMVVDEKERLRRLNQRDDGKKIEGNYDAHFAPYMNDKFMLWGNRLSWNILQFDNTSYTLPEACQKIDSLIFKKP